MTDETYKERESEENSDEDLRERLKRLEAANEDIRLVGNQRIALAELKVEAIRAGIIDLDGLRFLDMKQVTLDTDGNLSQGTELIAQLKRAKPWLFPVPSSSSIAKIPASAPPHRKMASDMTDEEYRVARARIIKHSLP